MEKIVKAVVLKGDASFLERTKREIIYVVICTNK
jgi:hypothetical protein